MAAITFGGAIAATAVPAEARDHGGYYRGYNGYDGGYRHHHGNGAGAAVAAGVVGLALGAALANSNNDHGYYSRGYAYNDRYYGDRYYRSGYYAPRAYYYDRGYDVCETSRWVYDPYIGRRVRVRSTYAC
jgi:hypothetical protein